MLGLPPSSTAQLAAERRSRFMAETADAGRRRRLHQPHPAPPCGHLAADLPPVVDDLGAVAGAETEAAATR